jgi:hypothetical protein
MDLTLPILFYFSLAPAVGIGLLAFSRGRQISIGRRCAQMAGALAVVFLSGFIAIRILPGRAFCSVWGIIGMAIPGLLYLCLLERFGIKNA